MDTQQYIKNVSTLKYDASTCIGCNICVEVCPHHVFRMNGKKAEIINKDKCMECGACANNCISKSISVNQGVGCATAVIFGWLYGTEARCDCGTSGKNSCCN